MILHIDDMHCAACVKRVRTALEKLPGAKVEEVVIGRAVVTGADAAAAIEAVRGAGYAARETSP
jgi:copper chaperone CopZ